jgi:Ca2+-binding EF-hand superfamily protein
VTRPALPAALAAALAAAVLAVPAASAAADRPPARAPDPRAVPEPAPAPRAVAPKFVVPKVPDAFEVLVFAAQRPVRIRVAILQEGKSIDELWRARLRKAFDFCDRDGDGSLDAKEVGYVFSDQGMNQLLANGFYQPGTTAPPTPAQMDKDGDGKVSFDEFVAYYRLTGAQVLRAQPIQPEANNSTAVTEALFQLMDADGDGKLTKGEVRAVEKLVASRDADEDECLSVEELLPDLSNPVYGRRGIPVPQRPGPAGYPTGGDRQMVVVYEAGRVPGTITQQVIKRYDKDGDFELTREEIGLDHATFKRLDADGNGKLDGEELDVWRTGTPDLELTLSMAPKAADCVARLSDPQSARDRGFKITQSEGGRLVLRVGRQPIDFWAFSPLGPTGQPSLKQQYGYLFQQAAGGKKYIEEKDLAGPNAVQFQFVRVIFDAADRDGDGKLTQAEFNAYFDLQDSFRNLSLSLTPSVQTPSLFQLLDENRDGRLSVRELRTAWDRLVVLEEPGAEVITKAVIQPSVTLRLSRTFDRFYVNQGMPFVVGFNQNPNGVPVPQKGPLWFRKMDRNGDGDVSRAEYVGTRAEFDAIDTDRDGLISLDEADAWDKKLRETPPEAPPPRPVGVTPNK